VRHRIRHLAGLALPSTTRLKATRRQLRRLGLGNDDEEADA
jgi:hypothetical protein